MRMVFGVLIGSKCSIIFAHSLQQLHLFTFIMASFGDHFQLIRKAHPSGIWYPLHAPAILSLEKILKKWTGPVSDTWVQKQQLYPTPNSEILSRDYFGKSLAFDGTHAVVGTVKRDRYKGRSNIRRLHFLLWLIPICRFPFEGDLWIKKQASESINFGLIYMSIHRYMEEIISGWSWFFQSRNIKN